MRTLFVFCFVCLRLYDLLHAVCYNLITYLQASFFSELYETSYPVHMVPVPQGCIILYTLAVPVVDRTSSKGG